MPSSDNDFNDDEDDLLLELDRKVTNRQQLNGPKTGDNTQTSRVITNPHNDATGGAQERELREKLYRSDGEVAILRAQLEQLQQSKSHEISQLASANDSLTKNQNEQLEALKFTVQRLEDEKRFLNNELLTTAGSKRRKFSGNQAVEHHQFEGSDANTSSSLKNQDASLVNLANSSETSILSSSSGLSSIQQKVIRLHNDSSQFIAYLWTYSINGSRRTSIQFLKKIYVDFDVEVGDFIVAKKAPLSDSLLEFLVSKKNLRLDVLMEKFCLNVMGLIEKLIDESLILSVPFLLSIIYCALTFRPAAISETLIKTLFIKISKIVHHYIFLLNSNMNQNDIVNFHDVPLQVALLEKLTLICSVDIIESLSSLSTLYEDDFIDTVWSEEIISSDLIRKILPENSERFKTTAQVNLIFNIVESLIYSVRENSFSFNNKNDCISNNTLVNSLLKIFLIDVPLKEDFMFYGLNRSIGNNSDMERIQQIIPEREDVLKNSMIMIPDPISIKSNQSDNRQRFERNLDHEFHLLNLRIRVTSLLELCIINLQSTAILESKENIKVIVRIIGFEQISVMKSPRSKHIHLRVQIIANLIKILSFIFDQYKNINDLIYPETIYEIFVVISRIAFGSDSLSHQGHKFLKQTRAKGFGKERVFNSWCEMRARELNHLGYSNPDFNTLADLESEFANGLEFPYEPETVELSRELLNRFVDHQEADNLFFNMIYEDSAKFDEMDLLEG